MHQAPTAAGVDLVIDVPGTGAPVLLIGHTDTVWPLGTLEGDVPWSVDGDVVRGPGAYDMKAGIVVMLEALRALQPLPLDRRRAVRVVLVADEEIGSPESGPLLAERAHGAAAAIGFESPHPDGALKVGRRGSARVRLTVTGRAAHAALDPEHGISAVDELVDQLLRIREIVSDPGLPGPVLSNVGTIAGGARTNVVPAHAAAEIGLRFTDPATEAAVLRALSALTPVRDGAIVAVDVLSARPAWQASPDDAALLDRIAAVGDGLGQRITGRPAAGAGDTNLLGALGLPTVDGFGPAAAAPMPWTSTSWDPLCGNASISCAPCSRSPRCDDTLPVRAPGLRFQGYVPDVGLIVCAFLLRCSCRASFHPRVSAVLHRMIHAHLVAFFRFFLGDTHQIP
ncbi:M20/M25/M40 family metallo-hydrolase [Microbacterium sp. Se63.02b]|uniref:M20/M25/M40 family metallo-hydrolase n=1 Tax=Microbacterium sp. Se63.02b TaxID=2709304 RepID=UPI001FCF1A81|nr:M20/M25/M40 family metallo-hydrolase [Microbacterium sp. Se63.02b]